MAPFSYVFVSHQSLLYFSWYCTLSCFSFVTRKFFPCCTIFIFLQHLAVQCSTLHISGEHHSLYRLCCTVPSLLSPPYLVSPVSTWVVLVSALIASPLLASSASTQIFLLYFLNANIILSSIEEQSHFGF